MPGEWRSLVQRARFGTVRSRVQIPPLRLERLNFFRVFWWVLFLSYAGLIFWLSDSPLPPGVPFIELPGADRLYHFFEYGLLSFLGLQAFLPTTRRQLLGVLMLCWLYGLSDEIHQAWVPGRSTDGLDWLMDGLGVFTVGWLWGYWRRL